MSRIINCDPGGEYLIPFAQKKVQAFHAEMLRTKVASLYRVLMVDDATRIHISILAVGHSIFIDKIRIAAGGVGDLVIRSAALKYATISWKGKTVSEADTSAELFHGYAVHACTGKKALMVSASTAHVVDLRTFKSVTGPISFVAASPLGGSYEEFAQYKALVPPLADQPQPVFIATYKLIASAGYSEFERATLDKDLNILSNETFSASFSTGSDFEYQFAGMDGVITADIRSQIHTGEQQFLTFDIATGAVTALQLTGGYVSDGTSAASSATTSANETRIVRPLREVFSSPPLPTDILVPTLEVNDRLTGAVITRLQVAAYSTGWRWLGLACNNENAFVAVSNAAGTDITAKHYDLTIDPSTGVAPYTETDITANLLAGRTVADLLYMVNGRVAETNPTY